MRDSLDVVKTSLSDLWEDVWSMAVCNLIWLVAVVLVLPGPPATLALFDYANRRAHGEPAGVRVFLSDLPRYAWAGWRWGLFTAALVGLLLGDFKLTGQLGGGEFIRFAQGFYLASLLIGLFLQLYALPFLIEQEQPSLRLALRNAAVLLGRNLGFSICLGALLAALLAAGTALFLLSLAMGGVWLALVGNYAVLNRLATSRVGSKASISET